MPKPKTREDRDYVVSLGNGAYYSRDISWAGVVRSKATWLTLVDADIIVQRLRKLRFAASVEPREV